MRIVSCGAWISVLVVLLASAVSIDTSDAGELKGRIEGVGKVGPAAVWIEGLAGDVPEVNTPITHKSGIFEPFLSIGFVGRQFVLRNEDDYLHNTHLYLRLAYQKDISTRPLLYGSTVYNVALPQAGTEVKRPIKPYHRYRDDTGFIEAVCNPHPDERAYVLVFDHPYATLADEDGSFTIPNVPPGKHEVRYWHDSVVATWQTVEVGDGDGTGVIIKLESSEE